MRALDATRLTGIDLVITSYGSLLRQPALAGMQWRVAILDEAQAIKNPGAKQTRQVKKLNAQSRIALTGTPVENRLSDLWSIFDFTHPGLLGSEKVFASFSQAAGEGRALRAAAHARAALHPAPPEDRQAGDRRLCRTRPNSRPGAT